MNWKAGVAVAAAVGIIGTSALGVLDPSAKSPEELTRTRQEQLIKQASDAQRIENERLRNSGNNLGEQVQRDKLVPGERRPPEPSKPKIRIRWP
jgi:hypothetical protein